jgi:hypothetical protein
MGNTHLWLFALVMAFLFVYLDIDFFSPSSLALIQTPHILSMMDKFCCPKWNSTGILQGIFWMKISQNMSVWLNQMVLAQHFCTIWSGWEKVTSKLNP